MQVMNCFEILSISVIKNIINEKILLFKFVRGVTKMKAENIKFWPLPGRKDPVIAIIGSDGSGKSTVGEALLDFMNRQRPTEFCHLGKQAGNFGRALRKLPLIGKPATKRSKKADKRRIEGKDARLIEVLVSFCFSMRRVWRFLRMRYRLHQGFAILTDRYPQNLLPGPMDGPCLADMNLPIKILRGKYTARVLSALELFIYKQICRFEPDLVIRLNVDIDTAMQRKPDHLRHRLERKIADLDKLSFGKTPVLDLDATKPLKEVLTEAKKAVDRVCQAYPIQRVGALIALVGCDGSGKSSLSADLVQSLASKRPTQYHYLGLGSGDLGRWIGTWPVIGAFLEKKLTGKAKKTRIKGGRIPGLLTALVVFGFSLLRYKRFLEMKNAVHEGFFVVTDRYPQDEIAGQCDGPGLGAGRSYNPLILFMARLERILYRKMASFRPDIVFFLKIDPETAQQRKPDHDIEALRVKAEIMPQLTFNHAPYEVIDASQAYLDVRQTLLNKLRDRGIYLS